MPPGYGHSVLPFLASLALAAPAVTVGGGPFTVVTADGGAGLGGRAMVGFPARTPWSVEVSADGGATQLGPLLAARAGVRLFSQPQTEPGLGALLAAGVSVDSGVSRPVGHVGLGLNVPTQSRLRWRVDAGMDLSVDGVETFQAGVLALVGPRVERPIPVEPPPPVQPALPVEPPPPVAETPVVEVPTPPVAEPAGPPLQVQPDDALVWIPHPVCAWVPAAESGELLATYNGDQPIQVAASGYLPTAVEPGSGPVVLEPAPERGSLVVAAYPGDQVTVGERTVPAGPGGVTVVSGEPGPVSVVARGSGREATLDGYVGDGFAMWVVVPPPEPTLVLFGSGSADLDAEARRELTTFARNMGAGRIRLNGGSSPEGNAAANDRLSRRRADAVRAFMLSQGVAESQIEMGEPVIADGPPGRQQRRVTITPLGVEP